MGANTITLRLYCFTSVVVVDNIVGVSLIFAVLCIGLNKSVSGIPCGFQWRYSK